MKSPSGHKYRRAAIPHIYCEIVTFQLTVRYYSVFDGTTDFGLNRRNVVAQFLTHVEINHEASLLLSLGRCDSQRVLFGVFSISGKQ